MSGLYQKVGIVVNRLAQDFLSRREGGRVPSISEYQEMFQVSRGTIQNGLRYLKDMGAVTLVSQGHLGSYIESLDYRRLQECSFNKELLGAMPLPYSVCYQGLATALFQALAPFAFNLVYARGSESRLKLVSSGACQFIICSRYAAETAIHCREDVEIVVDLGPETYLTRHVLLLRDPKAGRICSGMRVSYDRASLDHRRITELACAGVKDVELVDMRAHQTVAAIRSGQIDAGIWNLDEIIETGYEGLNLLPVDTFVDVSSFSTAVLMVHRGEEALAKLLREHVQAAKVRQIQKGVKMGAILADY